MKKKSFSLKSGTIENKGFRRCTQTQCEFYQKGNCRPCEDCGSVSFILDKNCKKCFDCENVPNELRFGSDKLKEKMSVPKLVPPQEDLVVVAMKKAIGREEELITQ